VTLLTGRLARTIQGSTHTPQQIVWKLQDGTLKDLSGATLTGTIKPTRSDTVRAITGSLTLIEASSGVFEWDYSAEDVETAGNFMVQFKATYGSESDYSDPAQWTVGVAYDEL
jgi:hypothetical protein